MSLASFGLGERSLLHLSNRIVLVHAFGKNNKLHLEFAFSVVFEHLTLCVSVCPSFRKRAWALPRQSLCLIDHVIITLRTSRIGAQSILGDFTSENLRVFSVGWGVSSDDNGTWSNVSSNKGSAQYLGWWESTSMLSRGILLKKKAPA